jgi:choline dehydrogenase-like flavoprotein
MGAEDWSWEAVLPYYRKLEDDPAPGNSHQQGGPIRIRRFLDEQQTPLTKAYIEACPAGHRYVDDLNGPNPLGVGPLPVNQVDGVRQSAAGAIAQAVRGAPTTEAHPIGTCSIGPGSTWGVVDQRGRVHGVSGLYVIDASIMPTLPVVPTNMTTIMLAERCADLMRQSFGHSDRQRRQQPAVLAR